MKVTNISINVKIGHYTYTVIQPFKHQEKNAFEKPSAVVVHCK